MTSPEARLAELGITLPAAAAPAANYVPAVIAGGLLHISGQIPFGPDGKPWQGRLGETMDVEQGQALVEEHRSGIAFDQIAHRF